MSFPELPGDFSWSGVLTFTSVSFISSSFTFLEKNIDTKLNFRIPDKGEY